MNILSQSQNDENEKIVKAYAILFTLRLTTKMFFDVYKNILIGQ